MALAAQMVDGKVVANYTTETKERKTGNDSLDKDAFLQILVAEMQYHHLAASVKSFLFR